MSKASLDHPLTNEFQLVLTRGYSAAEEQLTKRPKPAINPAHVQEVDRAILGEVKKLHFNHDFVNKLQRERIICSHKIE